MKPEACRGSWEFRGARVGQGKGRRGRKLTRYPAKTTDTLPTKLGTP